MEVYSEEEGKTALRRLALCVMAVSALWACLGPLGVSAESVGSGNQGFVMSPVFQEVDIKTGQATAQYVLTLENRSTVDQDFKLSAVDFGALDESGGVAFLGENSNNFERKYGLAKWMRLDKDSVVVPSGGSIQLHVSIDDSAALAPGGHYGAVLATAQTDTGGDATAPRVGIRQVVSSLALLVKYGGGLPDLRLVNQTDDSGPWRLPTQTGQRFYDAGSVHVTPRGVVEIKDPFGHVVSRGALNEDSGMILPESYRRYTTPIVSLAFAWMPGRYQLVTSYRYDGTALTKKLVTSFWYGGSALIWLIVVGMLLAMTGFSWWWYRGRGRVRA